MKFLDIFIMEGVLMKTLSKWRMEVFVNGNNFDQWSKARLLNKSAKPRGIENKDQPEQGKRQPLSSGMERRPNKLN